jgi:hypothetical protein
VTHTGQPYENAASAYYPFVSSDRAHPENFLCSSFGTILNSDHLCKGITQYAFADGSSIGHKFIQEVEKNGIMKQRYQCSLGWQRR